MNPTLLLPAVDPVVSRVEIRNEHSLIALQKVSHYGSLPCFRQAEDNVPAVSEYPDVMIDAPDAEPRLVNVDERTFPQTVHKDRLRTTIIVGERLDKIDNACLGRRLVE